MTKDLVRVVGIEELNKKLASIPAKMSKSAIRKASREVAKQTQKLARTYAPIGYEDGGSLQKGIKVRSATRKDIANALRITHRVAGKYYAGTSVQSGIRGDEYYGQFMEFGTDLRFNRAGSFRGLIPTNYFSFLRPALWRHPRRKQQEFVTQCRRFIKELHNK